MTSYKTVDDFLPYAHRRFPEFSKAQEAGFVVALKNTGNYYKEDIREYLPLLKKYLGK